MSRGRLPSLATFVVMLSCWCAASAQASTVVVLGPGGRARIGRDPFLPATSLTPAPGSRPARRSTYVARLATPRQAQYKPKPVTAASTLRKLYATAAIPRTEYLADRASLNAAGKALRHLVGTRATELGAVLGNLNAIAAAGKLIPSRVPALFATLSSNRRWWTTGPLLSSGERVEFTGSQLVWQYYPGQGIELQELGNFGKADGLYTAGPAHYPQLRQLLSELIPLAARRAGGLSWEYYFNFDGGRPPWTSAMSQATALEALTRAYEAFGDRSYLTLARQALPVFGVGPPTGVGLRTPLGRRYLQYSFAPAASIINAFLQTLIGLYDYSHVSGDARSARLFAAGDAEARAELPSFDTGAWSLYQPGVEDTLSYHQLVTGFLHQLCGRTGAAVYCTTAANFDADLKTPPALAQLTSSARKGKSFSIRFRLSKSSHVGIVVVRGSRTVFLTSGYFGYGVNSFAIPPLSRRGDYTVRLAATDLAGNFGRIVGTLKVSR